jgi:hypothetical protein
VAETYVVHLWKIIDQTINSGLNRKRLEEKKTRTTRGVIMVHVDAKGNKIQLWLAIQTPGNTRARIKLSGNVGM